VLTKIRSALRRWLAPDTRILRLDPHVRVWPPLPPARSDAYWDRLWAARLAANEARRGRARADAEEALPIFLKPQAS
jgi:hypothetical protein